MSDNRAAGIDHNHPHPLCPVRASLPEEGTMCGHRQIRGSCEFVDERRREKTGLLDCGFRQDWIKPPIKPTGYSWGSESSSQGESGGHHLPHVHTGTSHL